jgi:hypothetical protein
VSNKRNFGRVRQLLCVQVLANYTTTWTSWRWRAASKTNKQKKSPKVVARDQKFAFNCDTNGVGFIADLALNVITGRLQAHEVIVEEPGGRHDAASGQERRFGFAEFLGGRVLPGRRALLVLGRGRFLEPRPGFVDLRRKKNPIKSRRILAAGPRIKKILRGLQSPYFGRFVLLGESGLVVVAVASGVIGGVMRMIDDVFRVLEVDAAATHRPIGGRFNRRGRAQIDGRWERIATGPSVGTVETGQSRRPAA